MSENCNYAPVEKVILIDDRRIEIYWGEQMRRADNENDYLVKYKGEVQELVHWTSDMTWDYGTVYQKESMRTTLSLVHPVDPECAGEVTVQIVGKLTDVKDRPVDNEKVYQTVYQPYYVVRKKGTSGIVVKAGEKTTPAVVDKALAIIDMMLEKIPEVAEELVRRGAEVSVFGLLENAYDVPEHRMGYLLATRHVACNPSGWNEWSERPDACRHDPESISACQRQWFVAGHLCDQQLRRVFCNLKYCLVQCHAGRC